MILAKKSSFKQLHDSSVELAKIQQTVFDKLNAQKRSSFMFADSFIMICLHLNSKKDANSMQIKELEEGMIDLKKAFPNHHVIIGGDLNSFMAKSGPLKSAGFDIFPL